MAKQGKMILKFYRIPKSSLFLAKGGLNPAVPPGMLTHAVDTKTNLCIQHSPSIRAAVRIALRLAHRHVHSLLRDGIDEVVRKHTSGSRDSATAEKGDHATLSKYFE